MANRYWVGGSGTWGSTTKWSTTSGGTSGASVPTTADLAIFDANSDAGSAITVTLAAGASCGGITFADIDQNVSFTGAFTLTNVGNVTLSATKTVDVTGITLFTNNLTAQRSFTSNGGTLTGNMTINSATADGFTFQDNSTITGTVTLTLGNINLNGKTLTIGAFSSGGSGSRNIAWNTTNSKIVINGTGTTPWSVTSGTNLTFTSPQLSRIELQGVSAGTRSIRHNVGATSLSLNFYVTAGSDNVEVYAVTTSYIRTLDFTGFSGTWNATSYVHSGDLTLSTGMTCATGSTNITFTNALVVNQTVTTNGKKLNRNIIYTATGTNSSLVLADDMDLETGNFTFNLGTLDLGTNNKKLRCTNFTSSSATARVLAFGTTGKVELIGGTFSMTDITNFSYTGTSYILMSRDDGSGVAKSISVSSSATYAQSMNFYITGPSVGGSLVTPSIGCVFRTLDMSGCDSSLNTNAITVYGDLKIGLFGGIVASSNAITFAGTNVQGADGDGIMDFYTGPNVNCNRPVTKTGTSTLRLTSDLTMGTTLTRTFTLTQGTFDMQSYDLYIWGTFNSSGSTARTLTHDGSGKIYLTGSGTGTGVEMSTTTNLTVTAGLTFVATLVGATARTGTFNFGTLSEATVPNFTIDMTPSSSSTQTCTGYVNNITILNNTNANFALGAGGMTVYGNFSTGSNPVFSTSAGTLTFGKTSGTQTLTTSGETFAGPIVKTGAGALQMLDAWTTSGTFTHTQGTIDLNSKTLTLAQPYNTNNSNTRRIENTGGNTSGSLGKILVSYSTAGGVLFNATTSTGLSSDGNVLVEIQGAAVQTITPGIVSEANNPISFYINKSSSTATFSDSNNVGNLKINSAVVTTTTLNVYGDFVMQAGGSITTPLDFDKTSGTQTITSAAKTLSNITKNGAGTLQLLDALTMGSGTVFTFTEGTLDVNTYTFTIPGSVSSINNNVRVLSFSTNGKIVLSGSGTVWDASVGTGSLTTTGANLGLINLTSASAKTFTGNGGSYPKINQGGLGNLTINSDNTFYDISNSVQPATILFESSKTQTFTNGFSLLGTAGNLITINSTTSGVQHTLSKASGTVSVSFCNIKDSNATGGATWYSLTSNGNVDNGNNTGWIFSLFPVYVGMMTFF